jgi:kynurenine formamidase
MARRIVDLSVALKNGVPADPPAMQPSITYSDHSAGAQEFMGFFPGLKAEQLPDGQGPAIEKISLTTHNGTHLDAPWHFHSTMDGGKRAITIDEVPLEWCFSDGVKLDFRNLPDGHVCTADDVKRELDRISCQLKPFDIVLVNTAAGARYGEEDYLIRGCGMGREASREIGYCHMEKLTNLDQLPPSGFTVSCFPVKIDGASAGWTRCVAIFEE